jgi:hypothetical protein
VQGRPVRPPLLEPAQITRAEVADATDQGIQRVCKNEDLVVEFLAHTGLTLDP